MAWSVTYYTVVVEAQISDLAPGFLARFIRYAERMEQFGPDLGMPHPSHGWRLVRAPDKTPRREFEIAWRRMKEVT